jgi:uncharacterized protein (TIGR03086 family)
MWSGRRRSGADIRTCGCPIRGVVSRTALRAVAVLLWQFARVEHHRVWYVCLQGLLAHDDSIVGGGMSEVSDEVASSEVAERYERIAAGFSARVEGCIGEQWSGPTPCTEWTTAAIVEHVIGVHRLIQAMLEDGDVGAHVTEAELVAAWSDSTGSMQSALRDRSRASKVVVTPFGEMSFEDLASRVVCSDTLVHTWDLARATGQDEHLDARAVEFAWTWMEPAGERLRASGDFGPAVVPPPDADAQTRLLCFLGRDAGTRGND